MGFAVRFAYHSHLSIAIRCIYNNGARLTQGLSVLAGSGLVGPAERYVLRIAWPIIVPIRSKRTAKQSSDCVWQHFLSSKYAVDPPVGPTLSRLPYVHDNHTTSTSSPVLRNRLSSFAAALHSGVNTPKRTANLEPARCNVVKRHQHHPNPKNPFFLAAAGVGPWERNTTIS